MTRAADSWVNKVYNLSWVIFLIWTAVGAIVMPAEIGPRVVEKHVDIIGLKDALIYILKISDALWMVLAFATVYLHVLIYHGVSLARHWAAVILVGSAVIEAIGEKSGFPFGDYAYTDNMGLRIAGVLPFTIPLAWFVIVASARLFFDWWKPAWSRPQCALGVAAVATLTDLNLEFIAWKVRAYWIWYPPGTGLAMDPPSWPPLQNYISWFVVSFVLALAIPDAGKRRFPFRPVFVLGLMNLLFLTVHLVRWIRLG